jgi:hypothetical protein
MSTQTITAPPVKTGRGWLLAQFNKPEFKEMLLRMTERAENRIRNLTWMSVVAGPPPAGQNAVDIVSDVIGEIIGNDEETGPPAGVPMESWIYGRIYGRISNLVRSFENKFRMRAFAPGCDPIYDDSSKDAPGICAGNSLSEEAEVEREAKGLVENLRAAVSGDAQAAQAFECLLQGISKREEIAIMLGCNANDITNIRKRLDRITAKFAAANPGLNPYR